ncbi:MAG: Permeases of the major facilitator superfamily [uncultured bacterium]|nr:MAG: Permeases of the major facilitator superfamily [uncultured bacterium]
MANKKHKERLNDGKLRLITAISFLLGFSQSLLIYVESSYFKLSIGSENVSVFYFLSYAVSLFGLLNMHKIIKWIGKSTAFFLFFFLQICAMAVLTMVPPSMLGIILLMVNIITAYLMYVILDIIMESYSEDRKSGRIRGFHLMVISAGFMLGPILSTRILERYDYSGLFFLSMVISMLIFVVGLIGLRGGNNKFNGNITVRDLVKKIFVNKNLMRIYWVSFVLEFFYALMTVYTPLYLLDLGMTWGQIGVVLTIMLIPFIIINYPVGVIADKYLGEKEMIIFALFVMAISTISIFFVTTTSILIWGFVLFLTRIGAAMIETLRDSYFYKKIDGDDMDVISFFRTSRSVAYISATAISAMLLVIFSVKFVFLFLGVVILFALYPAFKLVDNKCELELGTKCRKIAASKS